MDVILDEQKAQKPRFHVAVRIILYFIVLFISIGIFQALGLFLGGFSTNEIQQFQDYGAKTELIMQILSLVPVLLITYLFRTTVDKKSFLSLGFSFKNRFSDFLFGLVVAVLLFSIGSGALALSGNIDFSPNGISLQILIINFLLFIGVAFMEEIMMRGYVLNNLLSSMNKYLALIISAVLFALIHGLNNGITWLAMLNLFLAGILLGAAYIFTKNLWFAISLHLFWNFIQGPVLGYRVSGHFTESFLAANPSGKQFISGGDFGFEGSVVCTVLTLALAFGIISFYEWKNRKELSRNRI